MADTTVSVIAAFYRNEDAATFVLDNLKRLQDEGDVRLLGAAIMMRDEQSDKLKIKETADLTAQKGTPAGAVVGGVIGLIFPPAVLATAAVGAAAGAAVGHFTDQGFNNNLLKEVGENLPPGGSAIVAVVEEVWFEKLAGSVSGYSQISRFAMDTDAAEQLVSRTA